MLIMLKTIHLFRKAVDFSLPMHSFRFLTGKKNRKGASWGHERNGLLCFSVLIYLLLFIMTPLLKLFCETKSRVGHRSRSTSRLSLTGSCIVLKILAQHLHVPKRLLMGCVSSFGNSSSNAFFAHLIPSGTAIIQAHSILRGWEKGTEQRRSQGVKTFPVTGA